MRAQEKQDEAWEKQLTSCQLFFLGLILPFPSPQPVFPEPLPVFHRGLSYEKVFPSFVYLLGKKITSVGKIEEKGKMGPAQNKKRIQKISSFLKRHSRGNVSCLKSYIKFRNMVWAFKT